MSHFMKSAAFALMVLLTGCSPDDGLVPISGTVTYDGKPVGTGSISFTPVNGEGISAGGQIVEGEYTARVSPGEMAVQIYGTEVVPKENATAEDLERGAGTTTENYIPAKYNKQSELRETITPDKDVYHFELKP